MFGQQADLQIEVSSLVVQCRHAILGYQDECREEDCLHRSEHGQVDEGGIKAGNKRQPPKIDCDPQAEQHDVQIDKPYAAGKTSDIIGQPLLPSLSFLFQAPASWEPLWFSVGGAASGFIAFLSMNF